MIPVLNLVMPLLDGITFEQMESNLGNSIIQLFGGSQAGFLLMALFFLIVLMVFMFKADVAFDAAFVIGGFALYLLTAGITGPSGGIGGGGLLPMSFLAIFILINGVIWYYAFFRRDF